MSFPIASSEDFGIAPSLLRTRSDTRIPAFLDARGDCLPGDLFLLATDAVAQAFLRDVEQGTPPDWERFPTLDLDTWRAEINDRRARRQIVNDDSTLICLCIPPDENRT